MKSDHHSIAGAVVLFNPSGDLLENVRTYLDQVTFLYVVDNSPFESRELIKQLGFHEKVKYFFLEGNKGIAVALNVAAREAIKDGFHFLLTMDQDTKLPLDFVSALLEGVEEGNIDQIGIIAPAYSPVKRERKDKSERILYTMTSGNLLNLRVYSKVGPFLEALFIDHVDHEYCLRLNSKGYSVLQLNSVEIDHRPGIRSKLATAAGKGFSFSTHSPVRTYYFCRNGFYVSSLYQNEFPRFRRYFIGRLAKELLKIPFQKERWQRIKLIATAFHDFKANQFGPLAVSND